MNHPRPEAWPSPEELRLRWNRLRDLLSRNNLDGALFLQNADLIYLCGTSQPEAVYLPVSGAPRTGLPLVMARPPLDRARQEAPWADVLPSPKGPELKKLLEDHTPGGLKVLGLELDVLPVSHFRRLRENSLSGLELEDASFPVRQARSRKSPFELELMKQAAREMDEAFRAVPSLLTPGVNEVGLETGIINILRNQGHQGIIRFRGFNQEIYYGHVLSGKNGLLEAKVSSPTGGAGMGPGCGHGAGLKSIQADELVSVDLVGTYGAYNIDQARLFFTGKTPPLIRETYDRLLRLVEELNDFIRPGRICRDVYEHSFFLAEKHGISDGYMGQGDYRCPFIGHGVGIELDELPILARGMPTALEAGMTYALEPRVFLPDIGVVGIEDTYHLTDEGPELITISDRNIIEALW